MKTADVEDHHHVIADDQEVAVRVAIMTETEVCILKQLCLKIFSLEFFLGALFKAGLSPTSTCCFSYVFLHIILF
jgi:hypothetical protein